MSKYLTRMAVNEWNILQVNQISSLRVWKVMIISRDKTVPLKVALAPKSICVQGKVRWGQGQRSALNWSSMWGQGRWLVWAAGGTHMIDLLWCHIVMHEDTHITQVICRQSVHWPPIMGRSYKHQSLVVLDSLAISEILNIYLHLLTSCFVCATS